MWKCPKCDELNDDNLDSCWACGKAKQQSLTECDKTSTKEKKIKCPFCGEEILADANKCRFCGEWLKKPAGRFGMTILDRGSADARSVTRGLKEKERHDWIVVMGTALAGMLAYQTGKHTHWVIGVVLFFVLVGLLGSWYWKE